MTQLMQLNIKVNFEMIKMKANQEFTSDTIKSQNEFKNNPN